MTLSLLLPRNVSDSYDKAYFCSKASCYSTLWVLATTIEYWTAAHLFGVTRCTVCSIVQETCKSTVHFYYQCIFSFQLAATYMQQFKDFLISGVYLNVQDQLMDHTYLLRWVIHVTIIEKDGTPLFYRLLLTINIFLLMRMSADHEVCIVPMCWPIYLCMKKYMMNSYFVEQYRMEFPSFHLVIQLTQCVLSWWRHFHTLEHCHRRNYITAEYVCKGRVVVEIAFGWLKVH